MTTLIILGATAIAIVVAIVLRLLRRPVPLERRIDTWAKRQGLTVIETEKIPDRSMDLGLPGTGSLSVRLLLRDPTGHTCEARVRFDVASTSHDSEHVQWTKKPKQA